MNGPETEAFTFVVLHRAAPQGSKVLDHGKGGKPFMRESSSGVRPFRTALKRAAMSSDGRPRAVFGEQPVVVQIEFEFLRPKSNSDPHATTQGTVGDVDKLSRAVLDGLTEAGVIADDRFVVKLEAVKSWGDEDRAIITVSPVITFVPEVDRVLAVDFGKYPPGTVDRTSLGLPALDFEIPTPRVANPFDF